MPAEFDIKDNGYEGLSSIEYAGRGVRYDLGRNTGLVHSYVDSNNVINGVTYFYAVTSYDHGDENAKIPPSESQRIIQRDAITRRFKFDVNTAMVVPGPPASNARDAQVLGADGNTARRVNGNATGKVQIEIMDPLKVVDGRKYQVAFDTLSTGEISYYVTDNIEQQVEFVARDTIIISTPAKNIIPGSVQVQAENGTVIDPANYDLDFASGRIRGVHPGDLPEGEKFTLTYKSAPVYFSRSLHNEDNNPVFDGLRIRVQDDPVALDPTRSGFKISTHNTNLRYVVRMAKVGRAKPLPTDFEITFSNYDTTATGELVSPADTSIITKVVTPFKIFDTTTGKQVDFFINESNPALRNKRWDYPETIVIINPNSTRPTDTVYEVQFSVPADTTYNATGDSIIAITPRPPVYPGEGDVFVVFSFKPFEAGDQYEFETKAVTFATQDAKNALSNVYAVPNPYVAFSAAEIASPIPGQRDDRRIEFRNLPEKCTIRIFTITGELVATLEKDDPSSSAIWNLLTSEGQKTAYGVYIYHVEAPGIGSTTGRLAIIK
ncbi:MAG: hypothetical protein D6814_17570 [Calditrichaeota bacterium]|nr:MAG: hypothetical protein D6814_17570 [Calditrichota bacterium]